jgi:hypothetical protein
VAGISKSLDGLGGGLARFLLEFLLRIVLSKVLQISIISEVIFLQTRFD